MFEDEYCSLIWGSLRIVTAVQAKRYLTWLLCGHFYWFSLKGRGLVGHFRLFQFQFQKYRKVKSICFRSWVWTKSKIWPATPFEQALQNEYNYVRLMFSCSAQFCSFPSVFLFQTRNVIVQDLGEWLVPRALYILLRHCFILL